MNRVVSAIALTGLVISGLAACNQAPPKAAPDLKAEAAAVTAAEEIVRAGYDGRDAAKIASAYAEAATVYVPMTPPRVGKEAIEKGAAQELADAASRLTFKNEKTAVAGDSAYTKGSFQYTGTNPATKKVETLNGSYVTIFAKQADGSWKIIEDIATPGPMPTS